MFQGFVFGINEVSGHQFSAVSSHLTETVDDTSAIFGSDEFRMFGYKIQRCPRTRSHDWTDCPYGHRGEKAQRRDPRRFNYSAVACPAYRNGSCPKGDYCEHAHGVFEFWLHPARYRTRACNAGSFCQRKVCFFAHTPEQLRPDTTKHKLLFHHLNAFRPRAVVGGGAGEAPAERKNDDVSEIINNNNNNNNNVRVVRENEGNFVGLEVSDLELPHIGWISELLQ